MTLLKTPTIKCPSFYIFFIQITGFWKSQDLFLGWHDGGETNNYPRGISHPWVNLWEGGVRSHFGLKDLGHALTDWLTSEWWERNPGMESELESISRMTDTERMRGGCLTSQSAILTYIFIPLVCVWGWSVFVFSCMLLCMQAFLFVCVGVNERTHAYNCVCMSVVVYVPFILHLLVFGGEWIHTWDCVCTRDESV